MMHARFRNCLTAGILACALILSACEKTVPPELPPRPVKSAVVDSGAGAIRNRVFSGTARSADAADLSFKVSGTVADVAVEIGDRVAPGDLIASLEADTYRVELDRSIAAAAQTNATRRNAEAEYQRIRQLFTNDNASRNELDTALANAESARASHAANEQSVRLARLNLGYTRLTADGNCSVANVQVDANENVTVGQTVAEVSCGDGWEVQIAVPESLIAQFSDGLTGSVAFTAVAGQTFSGVVTEVGVGAAGARTFPVTLALTEVPDSIRANLAAEVTFEFPGTNETGYAIYVPSVAVAQDAGGRYVYLIEPQGDGLSRLKRQAVEVGELTELGLEVTAGLAGGERVLTAGISNAREGLVVRAATD